MFGNLYMISFIRINRLKWVDHVNRMDKITESTFVK